MATVPLARDQHKRLVHLIAERGGVLTLNDRLSLLENAGLARFADRLPMDASPAQFAQALVRVLQDHGTLEHTGQPALVALLQELAERVSGHEDDAAFAAELLAPYPAPGTPAEGPPLKLFISYRKKSWAFTNPLADGLARLLRADVFVDFSGIDEANFESSILKHLTNSDVVVLVVSEYTFAPELIRRPNDWVRREIALALKLRKPIVLAAVDGLFPPAPAELPEDIQAIASMQGVKFLQEYWDPAVQRLADLIGKVARRDVTPDDPSLGVPPSVSADELPEQSQPMSNDASFDLASEKFEAGEFDEAVFRLTALKDANYEPVGGLDLTELLADAIAYRDAAELGRQADARYALIAKYGDKRLTAGQAARLWAQFCRDYPDYREDPAGLAERFKPTNPPPAPVPLPAPGSPERGADLRTSIHLAFEEAVFGVTRSVEVTRRELCDACHGSGVAAGMKPQTCTACTGKGRVARTRHLDVDIPAGVDEGTQIRLNGQGDHGLFGGPPGDLYVVLEVEPHAAFMRDGNNLHLELHISPADAALGTQVTVPTLGGPVPLAIPPATRSGDRLTLPGQGVPYLRRAGRGDLVVTVNMITPERLSPEQRRLYNDLLDLQRPRKSAP